MNDAAMAIPRCGHHHFSNGQKADADSTFSCAGGCSRDVPCMDGARGAREKNLTFSRNDTGAAMYPAFECSRCGRWP
jgi:hypothetical protein